LTGMISIGAGMIGYWYRRTHIVERIAAVAAGVMLIYPEGSTDLVGLGLFIALLALQLLIKQDEKKEVANA
ncbi:TRAP transporter permease, partial [Staphylococcus sp. SIMBA_130]